MDKVIEMIESSPSKKDAMGMLETYRVFGNITNEEYKKGREFIKEEFK